MNKDLIDTISAFTKTEKIEFEKYLKDKNKSELINILQSLLVLYFNDSN